MAAPTLQAEGGQNQVTTGTLTLTLPAHQADDILVATVLFWLPNTAGSAATIPNLSGWTKAASVMFPATPDGEIALFWRRAASGSETNPTFTRGASWDTGTDGIYAGRAYVIRGCITTGDPWDEIDPTGALTAANGSCDAVTVSGSERMVLQFLGKTDDFSTAPTISGWTAGAQTESTTGTDSSFGTFRQDNVSASTTADASTVEAPAAGAYVFIGASFKPAPVLGPVRVFDGSDDILTVDEGTLDAVPNGAWTMAVIARRSGHSGSRPFINLNKGTTNADRQLGIWSDSTDSEFYASNPAFARKFGLVMPNDVWCLLAATKAAGTSTPRGHMYRFDTQVWSHADGDGTMDNDANTITNVTFFNAPGDWPLPGKLAIAAVWSTALSDAALEGLTAAAQDWLDAAPAAMWRFNQASTGTAVVDDTSNGADQTALTGTTVDTTEAPDPFDFDLGGGAGAENGSGVIGLSSTATAVKVAPQTGHCTLGLAGTSTAVKATVQTGTTSAGLSGTSSARKVSPQTSTEPIGLATASTARKVAPTASRAAVGLAAYGPTQGIRAQTGQTAIGLATASTALHNAAPAGRAALGMTGRGTNVKRATPIALAGAGLAARGTAGHRANGSGISVLGLHGRGSPGHTGAATGRTFTALATHGTATVIVPVPGQGLDGSGTITTSHDGRGTTTTDLAGSATTTTDVDGRGTISS